MPFENYVVDVIEGRRGALLRPVLYTLSLGYRVLSYLHRLSMKPQKVNIPVISIGNITAGGTGKTPLIQYLAKKHKNVAIITRGYRSTLSSKKPVLICRGKGPLYSSKVCGDEPYLLSLTLPKTYIWIGKNRLKAAKLAEKKAKVILLDDGMQSYELHRDIEIVVMDGKDLFGKNHFLPRGYLREHPKRLKDADLIVVNHCVNYEATKKILSAYTDAPIAVMALKPQEVFIGKKVAVFCAIGKPQHFFSTVQELGAEIVDTLVAPDHKPFKVETLKAFWKKCPSAEYLLCTEKDAVKLPKNINLPIRVVKTTVEITQGKEHLENLWKNLK